MSKNNEPQQASAAVALKYDGERAPLQDNLRHQQRQSCSDQNPGHPLGNFGKYISKHSNVSLVCVRASICVRCRRPTRHNPFGTVDYPQVFVPARANTHIPGRTSGHRHYIVFNAMNAPSNTKGTASCNPATVKIRHSNGFSAHSGLACGPAVGNS